MSAGLNRTDIVLTYHCPTCFVLPSTKTPVFLALKSMVLSSSVHSVNVLPVTSESVFTGMRLWEAFSLCADASRISTKEPREALSICLCFSSGDVMEQKILLLQLGSTFRSLWMFLPYCWPCGFYTITLFFFCYYCVFLLLYFFWWRSASVNTTKQRKLKAKSTIVHNSCQKFIPHVFEIDRSRTIN